MFITVFDTLKDFGFKEESYRFDQDNFSCNYFFDAFDGFLGLESVSIKNKSVLFDEFLKLGTAIKFDHKWKHLQCSSKYTSNFLLNTVKVLFDSNAPSKRSLEFEWHLLFKDRWANRNDVMNFDFDSTYILLQYHTKENFMALATQDIFSNKLKQIKQRPITINDFDFEELVFFRLTIFSYTKLIATEDRSMYKHAQVGKPS